MQTLSSCYLCGAALSQPDGTHRLGTATVTLCSSCEARLGRLLDAAESSLSLAAVASTPTAPTAPASTSPPEAADCDRRTTAAADSDRPSPTDPSTRTNSRSDSSPATDAPPDATASQRSASADESADETEAEPQAASDEQVPDTRPDAGSAPKSERTQAETGHRAGDANMNADTDTNTSRDTDTDTNAGRSSGTPESAATEGPGAGRDVEITTREYRTLLRLLQNREFPVDRTEIEAVAASAYGYSQAKCAAVIDAAVDRGRLTERDGMLRTSSAD